MGYLDVMEPPNIDDDLTLSEQRIMEHRGEMRLGCTATGRPAPRIIWKREDGMDLLVGPCRNETTQRTRRHRLGTSGDQLFTVENFLCSTKVTRYHMATYLCIASNGVLPSVSKRINVIVMCEYRAQSPIFQLCSQLILRWANSSIEPTEHDWIF